MKKVFVSVFIICFLFISTLAHAEMLSFVEDELVKFELEQFSIDVPKSWKMTELGECTYIFSGEENTKTGGAYGFLAVTILKNVGDNILFHDQLIISSFEVDGFSDFTTTHVTIADSDVTLFDCLYEDDVYLSGSWLHNEGSIFIFFYTDTTTNVEAIHEKAKEFSLTMELRYNATSSQDAEYSEKQDYSIYDVTAPTVDCSEIDVRFVKNYIDGDDLYLKVFVQNSSECIFSGDVYVTFYTNNSRRLGSDLIFIDELLPGHEGWANVVVDVYNGMLKMNVDFLNVSFKKVNESSAEIDGYATRKTKESFGWNFDSTSWYDDITNITVNTDGVCVVNVKNPKEDGLFYASAIWSCGKQYGVTSVQVIDPNGKLLAVY